MSEDFPSSSDFTQERASAPETPVPEASGNKILKTLGLSALFIFLLVIFTLLKLPETRVTGLMQGQLQAQLDQYGIYISDRGRELSLWSGFRYKLDHPTLEFADQTRVELDSLSVSPKFSSMIQGKMGINAEVRQGSAIINFDGTGRGDIVDAKIDLNQVDIGRFGLLAYAAGLKGSGTISGNIQVAGTLSDPTTLNGMIDLKLRSFKLDEQSLMGFQIPSMNISEGTIKLDIAGGKLLIKTFQLGKGVDDLVLNLSGDIVLNRYVNASQLNLKAVFALSDKVRQNLAILESIISGAKTSDGRYAYKISGTLAAPNPVPDAGK
ncbi:MAG: type II secretion system protein GspN [Bdellovibrionales bacterium]|nr:type II secretion system protein GspN [Oligoflexia bacterium]